MSYETYPTENSQEFSRNFNNLSRESLVIVLEDCLRQQQQCKVQLLMGRQTNEKLEEQLETWRDKANSSSDNVLMMMYSQQRNLDKIDTLETMLARFGEKHNLPLSSKESSYQVKYRQLKRHLDLYMSTSIQTQEELLEGCRVGKRETARVYTEYGRAVYVADELKLRCGALELTLGLKDKELSKYRQESDSRRKTDRSKHHEEHKQNAKQNEQKQAKFKEEIRSLQFRFSGLCKERDIVGGQVNDLKQLNQQVKHQNHVLKQNIKKMEEYNKSLLDRLIEPSSTRESVSGRDLIDTWSVEVKRLKKQLEEVNQKLVQSKHQIAVLTLSNSSLEQKLAVVGASNEQLLRHNLNLSSEIGLTTQKETSKIFIVDKAQNDYTQGESTIFQSVELSWADRGKKTRNFLSNNQQRSIE